MTIAERVRRLKTKREKEEICFKNSIKAQTVIYANFSFMRVPDFKTATECIHFCCENQMSHVAVITYWFIDGSQYTLRLYGPDYWD